MNTKELPHYGKAVSALASMLHNLPGKLIAIDGKSGVGKTTLGRYLAWRFNITLIETDLFIVPRQGRLVYRKDEIDRIIDFRLRKPRPVIVDGVAVLRLLADLGRAPDYMIYVSSKDAPLSRALTEELQSYEASFSPLERANLVLQIGPEDFLNEEPAV
jgi:hypothetical protein